MRVRLTSVAEAELTEAVDWYAANAPREVTRFLSEFDRIKERLAENPAQFPTVYGEVRRVGFRRFPYGLFFVARLNTVEVFAWFHARRDPRRWQERL